MECLNPDCKNASRLKKLFAGVENYEELPTFCPYCQSTLRRSVVEKAKEENATSKANKNVRPPLQDEEKSAQAIRECQDQSTEENSSTVVKDEKPATVVTVSQYSIVINSTKTIENDATKAKDFSDNEKEEQSELDAARASMSDQALQEASLNVASDSNGKLSGQSLSKASPLSSPGKTDLPKSYHQEHSSYVDKDSKAVDCRVNDLVDSSNIIATSTASGESDGLQRKEYLQASQNCSQIADKFKPQDELIPQVTQTNKNELHQSVESNTGNTRRIESNITEIKQVSEDKKKENNDKVGGTHVSTSVQALQTSSSQDRYHGNSKSSSPLFSKPNPETDIGGDSSEDLRESIKEIGRVINDQDPKKKEHSPHYNTRLQASLNSTRPESNIITQDREKMPRVLDNHGVRNNDEMNKNQQHKSDGKPDGIHENSSKADITIFGQTCVFGTNESSILNSIATRNQESNSSQAKNETFVAKNISNQKGQPKQTSENNYKERLIHETDNKADHEKVFLRHEENLKLQDQTKEVEDTASGSDVSDGKESEPEEEMPPEQKNRSVPYGKDQIRQNRKERKMKRKKTKVANSTSMKELKKDEALQTSDVKIQMVMPLQCKQETNSPNISNGDSVTAWSSKSVDKELEQRIKHDNSTKQVTVPPIDAMAEDFLTVIFHALLSPDFHFNPKKQKVSIRAGLEELRSWKWNCTDDFVVIDKNKDEFVLIRGEMQVPIKLLHKPIPYKYVVFSSKTAFNWEYSEFRNDFHTIVNRSLFLLDKDRKRNAIYHRYDGVIYPPPEETNKWNPFTQIKTWISNAWHDRNQQFLKYRRYAAETFLPQWKGFVVHGRCEQMSAKEAIEKILAISRCLTNVYISLGYNMKKMTFDDLGFDKILSNFLKPKLEYNAKLRKEDLERSDVRVERLVSSLAITHLIAYYKLDLKFDQLRGIMHCLVLQASGSGRCDFDEIHKHFPEEMWSDLVPSVIHLMKVANEKHYYHSCPDWVLVVPLLHFLRKDLKPFEEPEVTQPKAMQEWCHSEGLPQYKPYNRFNSEAVLPEALPMFTLDPLLRRLFLCFTPLEDFHKLSHHMAFPVHEICTALFFKIRSENVLSMKKFDEIHEVLTELMKRLQTRRQREVFQQSEDMLNAKTAKYLLQELQKKVQIKDKLFLTGVQFAIDALCYVDCREEERKRVESEHHDQGNEDELRHRHEIFSGIIDVVRRTMEKEFYSKLSSFQERQANELKAWTSLLNLKTSSNNLRKNWTKGLVSLFEERLKKMYDKDVIDLFCKVEMEENFHQTLVQSITQHAFNLVEQMIEGASNSEQAMDALRKKSLQCSGTSKAGELLSRMLTRAWSKEMRNKTVKDQNILLYALKWKPWTGFINSYDSLEKQKILTEDANNLLQQVIGCLLSIQDALADGSIDVRTLTSLNQYQGKFIQLCCALTKIHPMKSEQNQKPSVEDVQMNLKKRNEEYALFQTTKDHIQDFINICTSNREVAFDFEQLETKANCDTSGKRISDLCKRVPTSDNLVEERIEVVFFGNLSSEFLSTLPRLSAAHKSRIFQGIWKRECKAVYREKQTNPMLSGELTLLDVQHKVWQPSIDKWTDLAQSIYNGSIHLKDVDRTFREIDTAEDVKQELHILFFTVNEAPFKKDRIARERTAQITRYRGLQDYIEAAETVWEFKEALGLNGDFTVIEEIRNQASEEFKDKHLKSIDEKFISAGENLKSISLENSRCLDAVIKCEPLVKWLRETIKDTSALSTLVDLAMISAGENDLEVDRISNFHTSCLNFAPLIFDLNKEYGFEDLMTACKPVWDAVKADKKLSKKLEETCRHLEWLKAVQSSHGSVEMSSIMQAKAINSTGVFRVGQILQDPNISISVSNGRKDLDSVLTLAIPIDQRTRDPRRQQGEEMMDFKDMEELKTYTLNDLKDLQSKLMLIAGKTAQLQNKDCIESTEEINRFAEVLEGMMRLGQVYIDLCEAGDVKYLEWSKEVRCSDSRLSTQRSVAEELAITSRAMEERLKKWRNHVHEKRRHYKQLNHYTTKQILVMRRELGLLREGASASDLPLQVYALLESVLQDVTSRDLNQVLMETLGFETEIQRNTTADIMMPSPAPHQGSFRSANLREKYQSFLFSVEKMDFDEEVAVAALKANDVINNHDVNEIHLITWCMNNGEDEETVSEWLEKARDDRDYTDFFPDLWQEEEEEVQDTELERSFSYDQDGQIEAPNSEEQLQDEFEQHPYLTLDELGYVLARLSSKCVKLDSRRFPDYLRHEQPNLILVPKGDILCTVLTLYMQYGGDSLPTPNEVLVCTHETTAEEVELFWWRALEDTSQQLFCLVNPDVLDYNVSQTAVNMLNILMHEFTTEGCRIIILCSTENEDRSHIIAALDEYRLNIVPSCASADVLSEYLAKQFTRSMSLTGYFNEERMSWIPAAHLDHDSLSVRLVCSDRAGVGKSLVVTRLFERISNLQNNLKVAKVKRNIPLTVTVPLHGTTANTGPLINGLWQHPVRGDLPVSRIVHLDVSPSVIEGLDTLLFNLLVLGVLCDSNGHLWRRKPSDLYVIEMTTSVSKVSGQTSAKPTSVVAFVSLLPTINCVAPKTTLQNLKTGQNTKSPLFDDQEYRSVPVQLAFQYLRACDIGQSLERFHFIPGSLVGTQAECLALIIKHCGIKDPSWSELKHFVDFLHSQIQDCEESIYCKAENVDDQWMQGTLKGFKSFVVRFMVTMSRDFATPSLDDNPMVCSPGLSEEEEDEDEDIKPLQLRRRWESSPHPYIFFNQDRITMMFLGFHINPNGDLIDPDTKTVIQSALMTKQLRIGLELQRVDFKTNYSAWSKQDRIDKLCSVMGVKERFDPDTSYELTIDNMKKILAILMRFRCGIPVVIMGETGCGKTRLIRYMCALQAGTKGQRNMLLMKVHGGTSYEDVIKKVEQVEKMAAENEKQGIDTVLFFDEANTTNALGMIKEVMVDRRIIGRPVGVGLRRLHFIAACNPYRRHTDKMIEKLESAGLGYSVKSNETKDKLGKIPLRHLVYRVHALPASMRPLVWDFGQLKPEIEELYIRQIVNRYVVIEKCIPGNDRHVKAISNVLGAAQRHMRKQQDECSFVSLRDVERTMTVMTWFYKHHIHLRTQATSSKKSDEEDNEMVTDDEEEGVEPMDMITWSLVLSLGVCYHAKLQDRSSFRKAVVSACSSPLNLNGGPEQMYREIDRCQKVMIDELNLGPNIARNTALSENVFMMVVCIELRIPLFVIGKPGSSKSLAKTVVADNMQGDASRSQLFKTFKRAHMVSYQCSPLSTPEGIVATFRQCRRLQENNPDKFASVVVLDEVGLAEDSPLMPLKTLHPLLEDGVTSSDDIIETDEKPTRVAFIGISNWALDPAKMNRGLMLMRGEPSEKELQDSAWGICAEREDVRTCLSTLLNQLAAGYADLYKKQKEFESLRKSKRDEFFGLRDFYSLVKMVYSIAAQKKDKPTWTELEHAIRRNFGGLDEIDAVEIFREHVINDDMMQDTEPVDTLDLLRASLDHKNTIGESRYLLVLTENYSALRIVEQQLIKNKDDYVVIFGSSFPKDQEYTQVCRNINQIKVCMETGRTVVLLNLESLYESLYDALNQYYVYCADQKYVDLGLGSHRVKCRVDDSFRLIVIAEKDVVYKKFPIPLINRLEKHYLVPSKSLKPVQMGLVQDLKTWAKDFAKVRTQRHESYQDFKIGDAFIGYQSDTIPAMVLQVCAEFSCHSDEAAPEEWIPTVKERCQNLLIQCATPDAMARLSRTNLKFRANHLWDIYFRQQEHTSLPACLKKLLDVKERRQGGLLVQVSTHSRLLSENDLADVCQVTCFNRRDIELLTLQQFQTEQQFLKQVREFFINLSGNEGILLVQCDSGDDNFNLIACTRHLLMDQRNKREEMLMEKLKIDNIPPIHIVIIVQLPRIKGGCTNFVGFQGGQWDSFHVDDLRPPTNQIPPIQALIDKPISELLKPVDDKSALADDQTQNEETVPTEEEEGEAQMEIDDANDDVFRQTLPCSPSEQEKLSVNHARFDPIVLLRRSVQAAAGRLEDDPVMAKRATERIDLILSLLPEDSSKMPDGPSFPRTLHLKIYNLLLEKDEKQTSIDLARHWVRNEALSGTSMHERGTFRRALQHKVLSEVEPLLAKVFAFTDRDCNLNLLLDQDPWISRLWISIFDNKSLSEMYYEISRTMIRERVQVSGRGKHAFRCCFPFSWLIKEIIDELWRGTADVSSRSGENEEDKLRGIMENSELRYILVIIKEEAKEDEAAGRYLHDFVHMVYQPSKENQGEEIQLVSKAIIATAEKRSKGETPLDFAAIHVAFNMIQSRLNNFNLLVQAEPDLTTLLLENPHPQLTIDVAALMVCLEKLQPCLLDIEASENRNQWCGRVLNIRKSIEAMTSKEVFSRKCGETGDYEEEEKNILQKCWMMWQHLSVVRIFIDHVCCMSQQPKAQNSQNVLKLWKIFDDDTNFMKATCIRRLESFLLECSQENRKRNHCFDEVTCVICLRSAKQPSVTPCGHCCCLECASRWFSEKSSCPSCRQPVSADYTPTESQHMREALNNVTRFRNQCNSFFMEVVSLFSFGYSPCGTLEEDAYKLLMDYVTGDKARDTKPFSPFPDQGIDVTPVVRSFLLQQLLKSSDTKVKEYMEVFIRRARDVMEMDVASSVEVFVMCIQCMEDALDSKFNKRVSELPLDSKMRILENDFKAAAAILREAREDEPIDVKWLEGIANTRYVLSKAAEFMYRSRSDTTNTWSHPDVNRALIRLIVEVKNMCVQTLLTTPRLFLLKQFSRKFGFESIDALAKEFDWILPPEGKVSSDVIQDRFLVYGLEYQRLRETVSRSLVSGDMDGIKEVLENMTSSTPVTSVALMLGVYQEVTANKQIVISSAIQESLEDFIQQSEHINAQSRVFARDLVTGTEGNISAVFRIAGDNTWDRSMVEIIIHLAAVLFSRDNDDLVSPLRSLALYPGTTADSFLPSMPDDQLQYARAALVGDQKLYECPNGHPYLVTECGRPTEKSRCRARGCGAEIGGTDHQLTASNRSARITDLSTKGHCLGSPAERESVPVPEREMSALVTCLVRLLVHGSMLIGSCYHTQDLCHIFSPAVPENSVQESLWKHVMCDMRLLSQASGRSVDDTALTVHLVLQRISRHAQMSQGHYDVLRTKDQRKLWEKLFSFSIIVPLLENLESDLQQTMRYIVNDERFGANPLLRQLYELESGEDESEVVSPNCIKLWRYRTPVTLDHVTRAFNESLDAQDDNCVVLGEFLKQEHKLRAVRFLPDVVKLQKLLMDRYHRTLDRTETDQVKWKDFEKRLPKGVVKEYKALRQSFRSAWNTMAATLGKQGTGGTLKKVSQCKVGDDSPMSMFIPDTSGYGICSLTLLQFLVQTHNEFMELYRRYSGNTILQEVPEMVTCSQLVSYDADRDLLPLIHAHCHYSLEVGHGTTVEYDWPALQRQLVDRLVRGRVLIDFKENEYLKTAQISAESVLTALKSKIPQVELSLAIQNQIIQQCRSLQDICEGLSCLNTAIKFLASGGGRPDMLISRYIHEVLKIPKDAGLRNTKAQEVCQIQNAVSLWRLLSIERAKILTKRGQDPFEHLSPDFKERLPEGVKLSLNNALRSMNEGCLDVFVSFFFEFIFLHLNDELDINKDYSLRDYVEWYLDDKDADPIPGLENIPEGVLLKHVVRFWQIVLGMSDRYHERRMQATGSRD